MLTTNEPQFEIRRAFLLEWPQPGAGVSQQILQSSDDLSDPGRWTDVSTSEKVQDDESDTYRMFIEPEGASTFYRVLELSD